MKKCLILGICLLLLSGCSLFEDSGQMNKSAQQLAAEGASAFMNEDYTDSVKAYTDLKDWYPFSKYAILAELPPIFMLHVVLIAINAVRFAELRRDDASRRLAKD